VWAATAVAAVASAGVVSLVFFLGLRGLEAGSEASDAGGRTCCALGGGGDASEAAEEDADEVASRVSSLVGVGAVAKASADFFGRQARLSGDLREGGATVSVEGRLIICGAGLRLRLPSFGGADESEGSARSGSGGSVSERESLVSIVSSHSVLVGDSSTWAIVMRSGRAACASLCMQRRSLGGGESCLRGDSIQTRVTLLWKAEKKEGGKGSLWWLHLNPVGEDVGACAKQVGNVCFGFFV
jgi:hypothetical protein